MGYNKFIQIGRVARINYGPLEGKLATIVDILNDKRVLVDGTDIQRQIIPVRRLQLTSQVVKIGRGSKTGKLRKAISKENVAKKFGESTLGKAFARQQRRLHLTDFERYKVLVLRRKLAKLTRAKPKKWSFIIYLNLLSIKLMLLICCQYHYLYVFCWLMPLNMRYVFIWDAQSWNRIFVVLALKCFHLLNVSDIVLNAREGR